jgi:hypothetical protein
VAAGEAACARASARERARQRRDRQHRQAAGLQERRLQVRRHRRQRGVHAPRRQRVRLVGHQHQGLALLQRVARQRHLPPRRRRRRHRRRQALRVQHQHDDVHLRQRRDALPRGHRRDGAADLRCR